jgi:YesN/AraC family two-component response regulator
VIIAKHNDIGEIARATFSYSKKLNGWYGNDVSVNKKFRRKGIMSAIYNFAEKLIGEKLKPSLSLSNNMKKFWKNRNYLSNYFRNINY